MLDERFEPLGKKLIDEFHQHANNAEERIATISEEIQREIDTMVIVGASISVIVIILSITIAMITSPIEILMGRMKSIALGNLNNRPFTVEAQDEIGQLVSASNDMNKSMRDIMLKITDVTDKLAAHSEELTDSTHEVRQVTERISTTMEELVYRIGNTGEPGKCVVWDYL